LCELDVGHSEWWSDADFHNQQWASVMYQRALGTSMYWWDWEQSSHLVPEQYTPGIPHRKNLRAINTFFTNNPPPFETELFYSRWNSDAGFGERVSTRKVEWIENVNLAGTKGFGWVHNSDYYWINDPLRLKK